MNIRAIHRSLPILAAAALLLVACAAPLSANLSRGAVAVTVTIPAVSCAAYPAALKTALSKPSRFIHPDTQRVEVSVSGADIATPLTESADIPPGSASASLTVGAIPAGTARTVTVSLYDAGAVLLAQSVSTVSISDGATTPVTATAVPVALEPSVEPGPYVAGTYGVLLGPTFGGKTTVFPFDLTNAGKYTVSFSDPAYIPQLYGPDGRSIELTHIGGTSLRSFTADRAGDYYAVLTLSSGYEGGGQLALDADIRVTASGPTLYVDPTLTVFDRQRAFTLTVACGYVTGTPPGILFGTAEETGTGKDISAVNGATITVTPGTTGLNPTAAAPTDCTMNFTDALLNIYRTGETFSLHAAPRTVVYLGGAGVKPADSAATATTGLGAAAYEVNNETALPVIAVLKDYSTVDPSIVTIDDPAIVLGGCDGTAWTREPAHGISTVNVRSSTNVSTLQTAMTAVGTVFDSLQFLCVGTNASASHATVLAAGKTFFRDCEFRFRNTTVNGSSGAVNYAYLRLDTQTELDRCSVIGEGVALNASSNSVAIRAIDITTDSAITILNSVVSPGNVTYAAGTMNSYSYGIYSSASLTQLNLAGSTVSGGAAVTESSYYRFNAVYLSAANNTLQFSNNLIVCDNPLSASANYAIFSFLATTTPKFQNNLIAYVNDPLTNDITTINYSYSNKSTWPTAFGTTNLFSLLSELSISTNDATQSAYLKPTGASPLTTGGATLTAAAAGFPPSGGEAAFAVDRLGNPRTAPYTIGAYED